jgi:hypothetical protein
MKMYFFYAIFNLVLCGSLFAQLPLTYGIRNTMDLYETNKLARGKEAYVLTEKEIEGSPYLNDEFSTGTIFTVQNIQYVEILLRYNIYNDNLEFKTPSNEVLSLANPEIVENAVFGGNQLVYSTFVQANKTNKGFLILLEKGKVSLFSKPVVIFKEATEPAAIKPTEPAKFVRKANEYFVKIGTESAKSISGKKELITAFPDNQEKIEKYIDKNKIKANKPEDLIEVVRYYNSL